MSRAALAVAVVLAACSSKGDPAPERLTSPPPSDAGTREARVRAALKERGVVPDVVWCADGQPCDVAVGGAKITVDTDGSGVTPHGVVLDVQRLADEIGDGITIVCAAPVLVIVHPVTCATTHPDGHITLTPKLDMDDVSWELVP